jgi:predicted RNase H-like HicB family nuclease
MEVFDMTFPVIVEPENGRFAASLAGVPGVRAVGTTRPEALASLQAELARRIEDGELAALEVPTEGILQLAGKYADDPSLRRICQDAYAERDRDRSTQ